MKKLFVLFFFLPFFAKAQFTITNNSSISLCEVRTGDWPLDVQRNIKESDTCYQLVFRDEQTTSGTNMTTLKFGNLAQLKYFQKGLAALKAGSTGDEAKFKDYTLKRVDVKNVKKNGICYLLTTNDGAITNFQQPEADKMVAAIKVL